MTAKGRKIDQQGRSKGEAHFVQLFCWIIKSEAWRSLSGNAVKLYVALKSYYYGENNGEIFMSHRKAAELLGVSENTAAKALNQLQDRGFIRPLVKGTFSRKQRHATKWILTEHDFNGRTATRDFMRWKPKQNTGAETKPDCPQFSGSRKSVPHILNQTAADIEAELRDQYNDTHSNSDAQIVTMGERGE